MDTKIDYNGQEITATGYEFNPTYRELDLGMVRHWKVIVHVNPQTLLNVKFVSSEFCKLYQHVKNIPVSIAWGY